VRLAERRQQGSELFEDRVGRLAVGWIEARDALRPHRVDAREDLAALMGEPRARDCELVVAQDLARDRLAFDVVHDEPWGPEVVDVCRPYHLGDRDTCVMRPPQELDLGATIRARWCSRRIAPEHQLALRSVGAERERPRLA
jgi:hypothetical protein